MSGFSSWHDRDAFVIALARELFAAIEAKERKRGPRIASKPFLKESDDLIDEMTKGAPAKTWRGPTKGTISRIARYAVETATALADAIEGDS